MEAAEQFFSGRHEAESVAQDIISEIVDRSGDILYDHYLEEKSAAYSVSRVLQDVKQVFNLLKMPKQTVPNSAGWECEEELEPSQIDNWAKGAVPTRKPVPPPPTSDLNDQDNSRHGPQSVASRRSKISKAQSRVRGAGRPPPIGIRPSTGAIPELDLEDRLRSPMIPPPDELPDVTPSGAVRAKALSEMKKAADKAAQARAAEEQEAADEKALKDKLRRDLKGKKFTRDTDGKVLVVHNVNPDRLPPSYYDVGIAFAPADEASADQDEESKTAHQQGSIIPSTSRASTHRSAARGSGQTQQRRRVRGSKPGPAKPEPGEFFEEAQHVQPPLLQTMSLSTGVKLVEGGDMKSGPRNKNRSMRRPQLNRKSLDETQAEFPVDDMAQDVLSDPDDTLLQSTYDGLREQDSLLTRQAGAGGVDGAASPTGSKTPGAGAGGGPQNQAGFGGGPSYVDVNLSMVQDPSWGKNVPVLEAPMSPTMPPNKPSKTQEFLTLGHRAKKPRDRPYVSKQGGNGRAKGSSRTSSLMLGASASATASELHSEESAEFGASQNWQEQSTTSPKSGTGTLFPVIPGAASPGRSRGHKGAPDWGPAALRVRDDSSVHVTEKARKLLLR